MTEPAPAPAPTLTPTLVEPVGGYGRDFDDWSHCLERGPLRGLIVKSGDIVDDVSAIHGGERIGHVEGGADGREIDLSEDPLVAISGFYGDYYGADHFFELSFHTAGGKTHGPFGGGRREGATPIELLAPDGQIIAALNGRALRHTDGTDYLSALGAWTIAQAPSRALELEASPQPGYRSDAVDAAEPDLLGIQRDVDALCMVMASRQIRPPLSIGLFGDWGSGKSFFMAKLRKRVEELAERSEPGGAFCKDVVHVEFNAWHFADANLWASLVTRIYDELYAHIGEADEVKLDKLRGSLKAQLDDAKKKRDAAQAELERAQAEREEAEVAREKAAKKRGGVEDLKLILASSEGVAEAGKALGAPAIVESYANLVEAAQSLRSLTTRGSAVGRMLLGSPLTKIAIPALVVTLGVPALLQLLLARYPGAMGSLDAFVAKVGASLSAAALWLSAQIKQASAHVATIEEAFATAKKRREELDEASRSDPEHRRCEEAIAREATARKAAEDARAEAEQIEQTLAEQHPRRRMERLITARATGDEYRKHLGIVSVIRKDFEDLSRELSAQAEEKGEATMRIILYIDDLDRCRPDRVVEVLEAVHLLLAFPLFVAVVGVDPRWLRRCLQSHYPELLGETTTTNVRTSTPQDYLEKIFQIPFALRRMSGPSSSTLIRNLLGPMPVEGERSSPTSPSPAPSGASAAKSEALAPSPVVDEPSAPRAVEVLLRSSKLLEFTADEHRDIREVGGLFSGPRAVKRFVNTYRLIRARIAPEDLRPFLRDRHYRAALVMLAIVTAYPNQASRFLRQLRWWLPRNIERGALTSWDDFMTTLEHPRAELEKLEDLPPSERERALLALGTELRSDGDGEWRTMCRKVRAAVRAMVPLRGDERMPFEEEVLAHWLDEASRYSFFFALAEG